MNKNVALDCGVLSLVTLITRVICRSHYLYDIDSVNFALAMRRFDPIVHQPHPPGYFLYVLCARLMQVFWADPNDALVAVSVIASILTVIGIFLLTRTWFGREAGLLAGVAFVFSPLSWFHGTVALTYIVEAAFSVWAGYFFWRARQGAASFLLAGALLTGLAAGFRPTFAVFLAPLLTYALLAVAPRVRVAALVTAGCALLLWFVPMIGASGGLQAYWRSLLVLMQLQAGKQAVWNSSPVTSFVRAVTIIGIGLVCFGFCSLLFLVRGARPIRRNITLFTLVWITPALFFFTFVFLRWINSGYLLILTPPLFAFCGYLAAHWLRGGALSVRLPLAAALLALNMCIYLFSPLYSSLRSVREFEAELTAVLRDLPRAGDPESTLIVGFDSHFLGYRHAGFYLPGYQIVQYPEVQYPAGKRVFAMYKGQTTLPALVDTSRFRQFVFCPLPNGDTEYQQYTKKIMAMLPPDHLRHLSAGNHDYVVGQISDLPLLFPSVIPRN